MPYKDPEKARQASKERMRRHRAQQEGVTDKEGVTPENVTPSQAILTPEGMAQAVPANYGQPDCQCRHCRNNRKTGSKLIINHGAYKTFEQLAANEVNRVSLPGDVDYNGVARANTG